MGGLSGDTLLGLPVLLHGIPLGRPVDIVVDADTRRAVGLVLLCGDRVERFLPLGAAALGSEQILVDSALAVLDDGAFYLDHGHSLRSLRGASVRRGRHELGRLADVVVAPDGELLELVLTHEGATTTVDVTDDLTVTPLAAAA